MNNISKTIVALMILLLASSFVLGNALAGYNAEKLANEYKTQAQKQISQLDTKHQIVLKAQETAFVNIALEQGVALDKMEPYVEQDGIYLVRLQQEAQDSMDSIDLEYLMWIESLRKPERRIFHLHNHGGY